MAPSLRRATKADHATIAACLVDAFAGDPFFRALWPTDELYRSAAAEWFAADVRQLAAHASFSMTSDGAGVTCWVPPGAAVAAAGEFDELQAIVDRTAGDRGAGAMAVLEATDAPDATRPTEDPVWTCVYVAVRPGAQGQGIGGRLVESPLSRADRAGLAVRLASTNPRNLAFYERLGFRTVAVVQPSVTLPPVWSLRREPGARREPER